jgi:hypothetical protein
VDKSRMVFLQQLRPISSVPRAALTKSAAEGHNENAWQSSTCARMAELADALASGASSRKGVEVRVLFRAPTFLARFISRPQKMHSLMVPRPILSRG